MIETRKLYFDSEDVGVYIAGDGVYNAPERDYEMVTIPGRNGNLAIDHGRYENIEVTYPAFIWANSQEEFREKLIRIRQKLTSKLGYRRLEDTYHPDEYRMAIYKSGLEVDPAHYNRAGEFEITFDCKPQRFLKSGEEKRDLSEWGDVEAESGYILHFDGALKNVKKFEFGVDVMQEGYRDPSLTNVRNFVPHGYGYFYKARKNLLRPTATSFPYESNGITYTKDDDGVITANGTATGNSYCQLGYRFPVYQNLMMTGCPKGGSASTYSLHLSDRGRAIYDTGDGAILTPNPYKNIVPENIYIAIRDGVTVNDLEFRPMVRLMDTSSDYEPFSGYLYDVNFNQDVYGGKYDYVSGVLTITHRLLDVTFTGSSTTNQSGKYAFYTPVVSGIKKPLNEEVPDAYCNRAVFTSRYDNYRNTEGVAIHPSEGRLYFYFNETSGMTLADAQSWLESNPIQVVYPLETPETVQLTARTLNTFEGVTNLYARSGSIDMEYGDKPGTVNNPTQYDALPLLETTGTGTLNVGNTSVTITGTSTQVLYIDSELMDAYSEVGGAMTPANDKITLTNFPTLEEGSTNVTYSGLTSVKITPRWWRL